MKEFHDIREFACKHFYTWEHGVDFDWLKKEWHKFDPHLKDLAEVEDFILTLADIYNSFCHEAYFATVTEEELKKCSGFIKTPEPEPAPDPPETIIIKNRIKNNFNKTLDILLEVYRFPEEIIREFSTIYIEFQIPHQDGYDYILNIFKDKFNPDKDIGISPF